ncbi:MAG: hypothetical protein HY870_21390 [Chloroflexi bacterium]|nr:hypothetical protein [Chloroflexota bacterium]
MTERPDFAKLENALIETGRSIEYPPTPKLAANVRRLLQADRAARPARSIFRSRAIAIGLAVIVVVIALLLIPQTREVIAQILGLRTIRVIEVAPTPTAVSATPQPSPTPGVVPFKQCCPSTLAEARKLAQFKILLPANQAPSQVFFQDQIFGRGSPAQQLVLVFGDPQQPDFVLYQAFSWLYQKAGVFGKGVGSGTVLTETQVNSQRALWFTGAPHLLVTLNERGEPIMGTERAVNANTLVWEVGTSDTATTYRLETTRSLEEAIRFAESLR